MLSVSHKSARRSNRARAGPCLNASLATARTRNITRRAVPPQQLAAYESHDGLEPLAPFHCVRFSSPAVVAHRQHLCHASMSCLIVSTEARSLITLESLR